MLPYSTRSKNVNQMNSRQETTIKYLNGAFAAKSRNFKNDNRKGTELYQAQVDFCYLINDIQRGPAYLVPKAIAAANELIDSM